VGAKVKKKIKTGYRVSKEAISRLKGEALRVEMTLEGCLDYLMVYGSYPGVKKSCNKGLEDSN